MIKSSICFISFGFNTNHQLTKLLYFALSLLRYNQLTSLMSHNKNKDALTHVKNLTAQELKSLLAKLENEHDILQAKNQELTIQISDLRNAVKCVQSERRQNVTFELQKKKKLQDKIDSLQKGLKYATKNHPYEAMQAYKSLMQ